MRSNDLFGIIVRSALIGLLIFGVWLVFKKPLHIDEAITYRHFVSQGWKIAVSTYPFPNNHVLFSAVAAVFAKLPLNTFVSMRLISLVAGVINGWLIFKIIRHQGATKQWAIIGVLLWATSLAGLTYITQARGYGLQLTFILLSLFAFVRLENLNEPKPMRLWLLLAISFALGLFTIPTFVIPGFSIGILMLLSIREGKVKWKPVVLYGLVAMVLSLLLYLPILKYAGLDALISNQWLQDRNVTNLGLKGASRFMYDLAAYLGPALLVGTVYLIWRKHKAVNTFNGRLIWVFLTAPLLYMLVSWSLPFPRTFAYLSAILAIALTIELGHESLAKGTGIKIAVVGLALVSWGISAVKLTPRDADPSAVALRMAQNAHVTELDTVYTSGWNPCGAMLDFYCWNQNYGPVVIPVYTSDAGGKMNTQNHEVLVTDQHLDDCKLLLEIERQAIYSCD